MLRKKINKLTPFKQTDNKILIITLILTILGVIIVADVSAPSAINSFSDKYYFAKQQLLSSFLGMISLFIFSKINYRFWKKIALVFFVVSVLLLILVLIPGIGSKLLGARRWIFLGPVSIQPSEIAKLAVVIYMAKLLDKNKNTLAFLIPAILIGFLVMLQPDFGTTMIIVTIVITAIFISGIPILRIIYLFFSVFILGILASILSPYRRDRLMTFFQQTQDPLGKGYHIRQILYALGSGGFFGIGIGQSRQKYLFLPEVETDSILAVVGEEVGFIGISFIIILYVALITHGLKVSLRAPDDFSKGLSALIVIWISAQCLLNIASITVLVPLTGIPLPFLSYGGSSLIMLLTAMGILINISKYGEK